jgi:hypothetical protein
MPNCAKSVKSCYKTIKGIECLKQGCDNDHDPVKAANIAAKIAGKKCLHIICPFGDACIYEHDSQTVMQKIKPCKNGIDCNSHKKCYFSHGETDEEVKARLLLANVNKQKSLDKK